MTKIIMMDFDGTLFPEESSTLSPEFIEKIIKLTDKGYIFSINSGRPYSSLKRLLAPIENRTMFVCNDGAQVMYKNCLVYKAPIERESARKVCKAAVENEITVLGCLRERTTHADADVVNNKSFFGEDVYKIILIKNNEDRANAEKVKALALRLGLKVCYEDDDYTEFNRADVNKGTACDEIKKKYDINGEFYAFGDSSYDIPMFNKADSKFVMRRAKNISIPGAKVIDNAQLYVLLNF